MLETICDIMLDAYKRNWITSRDGNVSIRNHDRNHFYITPSAVRKQTLQPDQFKKMNIQSGINSGSGSSSIWHTCSEGDYTDISKNLKPSGELPLHFGLQKELGQHGDDVRVVVHVHPTYCIAAMHAGIDLSTISADFPELNRYTAVGPNVGDVAPISQELADHCHRSFGLDSRGNIKFNIVGIKGHGVVAVDTTPWRAYEHIERLEHICKIVLASGVFNRVAPAQAQPMGNVAFKKAEDAYSNAAQAYNYARIAVKGPFQYGEASIARSAAFSHMYAEHVLRGRFPAGEAAIAADAEYSYYYARDVLKGPFPAGEASIRAMSQPFMAGPTMREMYEGLVGYKL